MRIYEVSVESTRYGRNWSNVKVDARNCEEAIRKAKKDFSSHERVEAVRLLAATD